MYFVKTKKLFDQQECKELQTKKEKIAERQQKDGTSTAAVSSPTKRGKNEKSDNNGFLEDELPDGACFRPKVVATEVNNDNDVSAVRSAEVCLCVNEVKRGGRPFSFCFIHCNQSIYNLIIIRLRLHKINVFNVQLYILT